MNVMAGIGVVKTEEEQEEVGISATLLFSKCPAKSAIERVKEESDSEEDMGDMGNMGNATTSNGTSTMDDTSAWCSLMLQQSKERAEQKRKRKKPDNGDPVLYSSSNSPNDLSSKWEKPAPVKRHQYATRNAQQADHADQRPQTPPPLLTKQLWKYRCSWKGCDEEFTSPKDVRVHIACEHESYQAKKKAKLNSSPLEPKEPANCQTRVLKILRQIRPPPVGPDAEPPELQAEETRMITVVRRPDDPKASRVAIMPKLQPPPTPNVFSDISDGLILPQKPPILPAQRQSTSRKASNDMVAKLTANIFKAAEALERTKHCQTVPTPLSDAMVQSDQDLKIRQIKDFEDRALSQQSKKTAPRVCKMASSMINSVHRYFVQRGSPMSVRETAAACGVCTATVRRALRKGQLKDEEDRYMLATCPIPPKELRKWNEEKGVNELRVLKAKEPTKNRKSKELVYIKQPIDRHRWSFFKRQPENTKMRTSITGGVCNRCNKLIPAKLGNTTGLFLHLKNYHTDDDYQALLELEKADRAREDKEEDGNGEEEEDDDDDSDYVGDDMEEMEEEDGDE